MTKVKIDNYVLRHFINLYNIKTIDKNYQYLYYRNHNYTIQFVCSKLNLIFSLPKCPELANCDVSFGGLCKWVFYAVRDMRVPTDAYI